MGGGPVDSGALLADQKRGSKGKGVRTETEKGKKKSPERVTQRKWVTHRYLKPWKRKKNVVKKNSAADGERREKTIPCEKGKGGRGGLDN